LLFGFLPSEKIISNLYLGFTKLVQLSSRDLKIIVINLENAFYVLELSEFLEQVGKEGNHWMNYHWIMDIIKNYEKEYGIKIWLITQDNVKKV